MELALCAAVGLLTAAVLVAREFAHREVRAELQREMARTRGEVVAVQRQLHQTIEDLFVLRKTLEASGAVSETSLCRGRERLLELRRERAREQEAIPADLELPPDAVLVVTPEDKVH